MFVPDSCKSNNPNETVIAKEKWNGDGFDLFIIDTPGFSSSTEDNTNKIYEMSKELMNFESIHLFLIVLDIDNYSSYYDLKKVLNTFKLIYGAEFIKNNAVIVNWSDYEE